MDADDYIIKPFDLDEVIMLVLIKKDIKRMSDELDKNRSDGYNRQLRISLIDSSLERLATSINKSLDYQKMLKLSVKESRKQLQQTVV